MPLGHSQVSENRDQGEHEQRESKRKSDSAQVSLNPFAMNRSGLGRRHSHTLDGFFDAGTDHAAAPHVQRLNAKAIFKFQSCVGSAALPPPAWGWGTGGIGWDSSAVSSHSV